MPITDNDVEVHLAQIDGVPYNPIDITDVLKYIQSGNAYDTSEASGIQAEDIEYYLDFIKTMYLDTSKYMAVD